MAYNGLADNARSLIFGVVKAIKYDDSSYKPMYQVIWTNDEYENERGAWLPEYHITGYRRLYKEYVDGGMHQ